MNDTGGAVSVAQAADAYAAAWQAMRADNVAAQVGRMFAEEGRFIDPFNDLRGRAAIERSFAHLYGMIDEVAIDVTDRAFSGRVAYLRWRFVYRLKSGRAFDITGMSEVHFAADGRATAHIDHWDAASQFYERLAVIGWLLRRIKRRLQV